MEITPSRIGFIATHFNRADRVSLESERWRAVLTGMGHECFFFTGESAQPEERTVIVPEADFRSRDIQQLIQELYGEGKRSSKTSGTIQALRFHIKQHLYQFVQTFDINLLIVENALSLPLNIPLGLAITEVIAETGITCFARHYDFAWEQPRYYNSPAIDYILSGFPPRLPSLYHIVATRTHADQLAMRVGAHAHVIPFVRDFQGTAKDHPQITSEVRDILGIGRDTQLALSASPFKPTSRIDALLALTARMDAPPELLLTAVPDSSQEDYFKFIVETGELYGCKLHLAGDQLAAHAESEDSQEAAIGPFYHNAAFACALGYTQEAAAEAIDAFFFAKPLVTMRSNPAFIDLKHLGFRFLEIQDVVHLETARFLEGELRNTGALTEMIDVNFRLGVQHLSLDILQRKLSDLLLETLTT